MEGTELKDADDRANSAAPIAGFASSKRTTEIWLSKISPRHHEVDEERLSFTGDEKMKKNVLGHRGSVFVVVVVSDVDHIEVDK